MKKKIIGIFTFILLIASTFTAYELDITENIENKQLLIENDENCAGAIATGSVVKDGRSIFWKNRHYSGENNKPFFYQGDEYKFYGIGQNSGQCLMGLNEKGLAMGGFSVSGPLDNWEYISDGILVGSSVIQSYLLGNFDNVYDTAMFAAQHISGNYQYGIISSEPGVGAVLAVSEYDGTIRTNITWINNTYAALANAFYCDGDHDPDGNDITIDNMLDDIVTNGGINGDFKIDWEEVCQRGGKNVSGKEKGSGTFDCTGEITKAICVSGFVAVSGNSSFDGAANIGWLAMGRQPLVGIWLTLGASCLNGTSDIPFEFRDGGGIEDYVDPKVFYATNGAGQGSDIYYCERVREILNCTNSNESYMFDEYDELMGDIPSDATPSEVKSIIYSFVEDMVPTVLSAYESYNHPPNEPSDPDPEDGSTDVSIYTDLSWTGGDPDGDSVTYDVYFEAGDSTPDELVSEKQSDTTYDPGTLEEYTEYYWRIVAWDEWTLETGPIWSFTTGENLPPNEPSDPDPPDGATDVPIVKILSWTGGDPNDGDTVTYDVYFGNSSPPPIVAEDISQTSYDPDTMDLDTTYYWQIVAEDSQGLSTSGDIWYFTTELEPNEPPNAPTITGEKEGKIGKEYEYTFKSVDANGDKVRYHIDWGDGNQEWTDYYIQNTDVKVKHIYEDKGSYGIKAYAQDEKGADGPETEYEVTMPKNKPFIFNFSLLNWLFDRFPNVFSILRYIFGL